MVEPKTKRKIKVSMFQDILNYSLVLVLSQLAYCLHYFLKNYFPLKL